MAKHPYDRARNDVLGLFSRAQMAAMLLSALLGAAIGAFFGVQAYYHGWLG